MKSSEEPEPSVASRRRPDLVLVGCVKTKRTARNAAKELYSSPLWRYRRAYAECLGVPWYILSALHGLLDPDRRIDSYNLTLTDLRPKARRVWSAQVFGELTRWIPSIRDKLIEIHAGAAYVNYGLERGLRDAGAEVHRPLAGITGIGRQYVWYREKLQANGKPDKPRSRARSRAGKIAKLIADDFYGGRLDLASRGMALGQPWRDMPEVDAVNRLSESGVQVETRHDSALADSVNRMTHVSSVGDTYRTVRLFLTFIAAMDRVRDATQLWNAGVKLYRDHPESFDPKHVEKVEVGALASMLKAAHVSRKHGPDSNAWRQIAKSLSSGINSPVSRVIDAGVGEAEELLRDLKSRDSSGRARFPMLRGPKVGPMWIRMMANPGRARIHGVEIIPVAVDVQVRRATENLDMTATNGLPLRKATPVIQEVWMNAVSEADITGTAGIQGTCAALDPALWFFGKHGCGYCSNADEQVSFGRACDFCVRFR